MNLEIAILREVVTKVTGLLAGRKITVTQRGTQAFVEPDPKTGKPKRVNIPYLPDNASQELLVAIQGFIDHEIGHVLDTDFKVSAAAGKQGAVVHSMWNIVEDTFVERQMQKRFPGASWNLQRLHNFFTREITDKLLVEAAGDERRLYSALIVPAVRAWSGQQHFIDYMEDKWHLIEEPVARIGALKDEVSKVRSSQDSLDLALKIIAATKPPVTLPPPSKSTPKAESEETAPAKAPKSEPEDEEGEDAPAASKEPDESEETPEPKDESEEAAADAEDEGEDPAESGPGAEEPEDEAGAEDDDSAEDEAPGSGAPEDDEGEDAPSASSEDEDDDGEVEPEADEEGEDEDELAAAGGEPDDEAESAGGGAEPDEDDGEDEGSSGSASGEPEDPDEAGEDPDDGEADSGTVVIPEHMDYSDVEGGDFDKSITDVISDQVCEAGRDAEYMIYTKDFDTIELLEPHSRSEDPAFDPRDTPAKLDDRVRHLVGVMQKNLERLIAARSRSVMVPGHRSGRMHGGSLHRLVTGDERVFRRREEHRTKDVAVSILGDWSGSMRGIKFQTMIDACFALSQTLDRINISHEVLGFTTKGFNGRGGVSREMMDYEESKLGRRFSRYEPIYMPILKEFGERLTTQAKLRFASADQVSLCNNIDGECVEIAGLRLLQRRETRKILMVLSDGAPACAGVSADQHANLRRVVAGLESRGIETIGIGIMDDAVQHFYPKHVVLKELDQLPGEVMDQLKHILL
ncbi:cobaltochelatase CobT-related protein [Inquilinus sp. OTU3971]|uniref:cobaltochelatase CobT-related protein n=1 Tax=Inquilinus sp. OTU3971 TaxID=3043855 RepID=UPI00313D2AE9